MRKGMAVDTVTKFLICLIALAILAFLIYKYVLGSDLDRQTCATRMTAWCTQCQIAEFDGGQGMDDKLDECIPEFLDVTFRDTNCNGAETDCEGFLPGVT